MLRKNEKKNNKIYILHLCVGNCLLGFRKLGSITKLNKNNYLTGNQNI